MATDGWEDFSGGHSNSGRVVAIAGNEELAGKRGEGPRVHDSTLGKDREQEKTMANSTRQSTVAKMEQRWLAGEQW